MPETSDSTPSSDAHSFHACGHFLPLQKAKLLELLESDALLEFGPKPDFRRLIAILESWFQHSFQGTRETMKRAFARFDVEHAERWGAADEEQKHRAAATLSSELDALLIRSNYTRIAYEDLDPNHLRESIQKIALQVRLEDFEELVIYRRGMTTCTESIPSWFGLKHKRVEIPGFDRVCFFLRFKDQAYFDANKRKGMPFAPGSISLKLFRNIPCVDLGTLFPNAEVRMRLSDRLWIGLPAAAGIIHFLFFKVGLAALAAIGAALLFITSLSKDSPDTGRLITASITLGVFGGFLLRKFNQFRNRKIYFLKVLSENLYFRNLDNDAGVFLHLLDAAEEAELKEAMLAYAFLRAAEAPLTKAELDRSVESWLGKRLACDLDFEVDDALRKLVELDLVQMDAQGRHSALEVQAAIELMERRWNALHAAGT